MTLPGSVEGICRKGLAAVPLQSGHSTIGAMVHPSASLLLPSAVRQQLMQVIRKGGRSCFRFCGLILEPPFWVVYWLVLFNRLVAN